MSADYDRLFHSPDVVKTAEEETAHVDPDTVTPGSAGSMPSSGPGRNEASGPMPVAPPRTQTATAPPPRQGEVTTQMPTTHTTGPQRVPNNGMMRAPQSMAPAGARYEQPHQAPAHESRPASAPSPTQHFADGEARRPGKAVATQPAPTSAATIGNHRAIDALSHVGVRSAVKMPSRRGWRHCLYLLTRINLGLSPDELYEMDLHTRIRRNARDSYQIGVFGLKGGVGKTAVTVALWARR